MGNFLINLVSVLSLGLFLLRNQRNILVCKKCSFPTGTNRGFLAERLLCKKCSALVESLVCKHFSTFLIPCSLHTSLYPASSIQASSFFPPHPQYLAIHPWWQRWLLHFRPSCLQYREDGGKLRKREAHIFLILKFCVSFSFYF